MCIRDSATAIFGGISISMWMWSAHTSASIILIPFQSVSYTHLTAIAEHARVRFTYYYAKGVAEKCAEPYRIVFQWGD